MEVKTNRTTQSLSLRTHRPEDMRLIVTVNEDGKKLVVDHQVFEIWE
jgi:hypothetical protein